MPVKLTSRLPWITAEIQGRLDAVVAQGGSAIEHTARGLAPVRSGALRSSISSRASGSVAEVSAGVEYASYVEYGNSRMRARPYLRPAHSMHRDEIVADAARALRGL